MGHLCQTEHIFYSHIISYFLCFYVLKVSKCHFFKTVSYFCRINASGQVQKIGQCSEVTKFLGTYEPPKKVPGCISLLQRGQTGRPIEESHNDDVLLSAIISLQFPTANMSQYRLKRGRGVSTQSMELVVADDWVSYKDKNDNVS